LPPLNSLRYGEEFQPWMEFQLDSVLLGVEKQLATNGSLDFENMVDFVFFKNNLSSTSILSMSAWEHMLPGLWYTYVELTCATCHLSIGEALNISINWVLLVFLYFGNVWLEKK